MLNASKRLLTLYPKISCVADVAPVVIFLYSYLYDYNEIVNCDYAPFQKYFLSLRGFRNFLIHYDKGSVITNFLEVDATTYNQVHEYLVYIGTIDNAALTAMNLLHNSHKTIHNLITRVIGTRTKQRNQLLLDEFG